MALGFAPRLLQDPWRCAPSSLAPGSGEEDGGFRVQSTGRVRAAWCATQAGASWVWICPSGVTSSLAPPSASGVMWVGGHRTPFLLPLGAMCSEANVPVLCPPCPPGSVEGTLGLGHVSVWTTQGSCCCVPAEWGPCVLTLEGSVPTQHRVWDLSQWCQSTSNKNHE